MIKVIFEESEEKFVIMGHEIKHLRILKEETKEKTYRLLEKIPNFIPIQHELVFTVTADRVLIKPPLTFAAGMFIVNKNPQIIIAGGRQEENVDTFSFSENGLIKKEVKKNAEDKYSYFFTIIHEFVHYEQWSKRKPVIERGVNVRTKNLLKKMGL